MYVYPIPFYTSCFICSFICLSFRDTYHHRHNMEHIMLFPLWCNSQERSNFFALGHQYTQSRSWTQRSSKQTPTETVITERCLFCVWHYASCSTQQLLALFNLLKRLWPWHVIIFFLEVIKRGRNFPQHIPPASAFNHSTLLHLRRSQCMHLPHERVRDGTRTMKGKWD